MGKTIQVLLVEDNEQDALLVVRELKRGGFEVSFERVETREGMLGALENGQWDVIVSDYSMPQFGAPMALQLLKERKLDLPFIIVSGTVGEDIAVRAIQAGAHDFMSKEKLVRLIPAIERELRAVKLRAEQTQLQDQLVISDRMASVGTLAAGVAHEINNPLAALMANVDFAGQDVAKLVEDVIIQRDQTSGDQNVDGTSEWIATRLQEIEASLRDARECAERVRNIVRDLKIFSRSDEEKTGPVDVRRVIESALRMAWNEIRHRARLVKDYGEVPAIEGNEGRLGQVFLNLIVNAAQAMPEGRADKNEIRIVTWLDDHGKVVVEVRDTGVGIPEAALSRIFDPFFTTKPVGEGTGLGLSICLRIVTALGGKLSVDSKVGKGTTFRIALPVAKSEVAGVSPVFAAAKLVKRGRILVVDDEPMFGAAVRRMLSEEHEVFSVTSARDAMGLIDKGEHFDVILCDLMMPEVTGMDLYSELLRRAPAQAEKVVFMTGGAFTSGARGFLDQVRNPRVEKPFDVGSVKALVHGMLR